MKRLTPPRQPAATAGTPLIRFLLLIELNWIDPAGPQRLTDLGFREAHASQALGKWCELPCVPQVGWQVFDGEEIDLVVETVTWWTETGQIDVTCKDIEMGMATRKKFDAAVARWVADGWADVESVE